ncbi:MAG: pilus assembly protein, partial [Rhodanobacter sp.]
MSYKAGYDTNDWTGAVSANPLNADGSVSIVSQWDGSALLDSRSASGRVILTSTAVGTGNGAAFTGATVVNAINALDSGFGTGTSGANRLAWLRGDKSKEGTNFRQRNHLLGAVMNAQALYVALPSSGYRNIWPSTSDEAEAEEDGTGYSKFVSDHSKRAPTLYVAANDGMLHAFDASTADDTYPDTVDVEPSPGKERWAYAPYSAYGQLNGWSSLTDFSFEPSVDGTPVSRDVYFSSGSDTGWHTILVAGLRYGGRGVYALDITDASASEASPGKTVLWEFNNTSTGGANLGYTYGRPNIGRMASGKWVVTVPAGYFPTDSKDAATKNKYSSLFVLDAQTGALIREIKTPTTVSG